MLPLLPLLYRTFVPPSAVKGKTPPAALSPTNRHFFSSRKFLALGNLQKRGGSSRFCDYFVHRQFMRDNLSKQCCCRDL